MNRYRTVLSIILFFFILTRITSASDPIRINCGGPRIEFENGVVFIADKYYNNTYKYQNPEINDIFGTRRDELYFTERAGDNDLAAFEYDIPVSPGNYNIILHFAEIYWGCPNGPAGGIGKRVFNVTIGDSLVLHNFDITAEAGVATALVKSFFIQVNSDTLKIRFKPMVNRGKVSGIEILSDGQSPLSVNSRIINSDIPRQFSVKQNYPNPFNPQTKIEFDLPEAGRTKLTIFNIVGQEVKVLMDQYLSAGTQQVEFVPDNLESGIYLYKVETDHFSAVRKMIYLK